MASGKIATNGGFLEIELVEVVNEEDKLLLGCGGGGRNFISKSPSNIIIRRKAAKATTLTLFIIFALVTTVQQYWINRGTTSNFDHEDILHHDNPHDQLKNNSYAPTSTTYVISDEIKIMYDQWHKLVRNLSQMELQPTNWTPQIKNWDDHPKNRSDRFPSIHERVQYYMGKWYNTSIPMYGATFHKDTFIQQKTTRKYGPFSDILVNMYILDKHQLYKCYQNKKELKVFSPYCRDYIDLAILHSEGSANILHYIGDGLPYIPDEMQKYPLIAKVRPLCSSTNSSNNNIDFTNKLCMKNEVMETILFPLNRKRHLGVASLVPANDIPWEQKISNAVWRGKYGKTTQGDTISDTDNIKYALVSKHLNSSLVDAKFSKHTKDSPRDMIDSYMDIKDQLAYKYIISIEGNDVSSGLKWMLFSNSVVLTPPFTWESWSMEGILKPFVHYIPLKADMSNVEEMIQWAETHPEETLLISERSTLFIYDLLFHPDAIEDEKKIIMQIMEQFENNFGHDTTMKKRQSNAMMNIQWNKHPSGRASRFPSVEERVKYAMGKWYHNEDSVSMRRSDIQKVSSLEKINHIIGGSLFIASGLHLSTCAMPNGTYSQDLRALCQSSLPDFDERNTADLKSNSFSRLSKSEIGKDMKLASESSWRQDGKGLKESKRVLLDDTIKVLCYVEDCSRTDISVPYFSSYRRSDEAIVWPLDLKNAVDIVNSGWVETVDMSFEDKKPSAIGMEGLDSDGAGKREEHIRHMLSYRYLLVKESKDEINEDFLWMLQSQSESL